MKKTFSLLLAFILTTLVIAQVNVRPTGENLTPTALNVQDLAPGEALTAFDLRPTEPDGSPNYFEGFNPGAIRLRDGSVLSGFAIDYNIQRYNVVVEHDGAVYDIPGFMVREFVLEVPVGKKKENRTETKRFINPNEYYDLPQSVPHFVEVSGDDDPQPFKIYFGAEVTERAPNYNAALDVGSRSVRYFKKDRYFFYDGTDFRMIPGNAKKAKRFFLDTYPQAKALINQQKLRLDELEDLMVLVQQLKG